MFALGLTGSIATGKSTVLKMFAHRDIPIYSADEAVHALYRGDAVGPVSAVFDGVVKDGAIDRHALAQILIKTPERMAELEAIVHPMVGGKMREFLENAAQTGADLAVLEIPLLYETGKSYPVDAVAVTHCSAEEQQRRALARPGMTVEKFKTILARQMPQADKVKRADFAIDTGSGLDETRGQVDNVIAQCRARHEKT